MESLLPRKEVTEDWVGEPRELIMCQIKKATKRGKKDHKVSPESTEGSGGGNASLALLVKLVVYLYPMT